MNQIIFLIISIFFLNCSSSVQQQETFPSLIDTRWESKIAEGCINYILFKKDNTYENYSCELDYPFAGKYQVQKDTLYLTEIDLASDLPGEKRMVTKARYKVVLKNEKLKFVSREELENGKWIKSNFQPSEEFLYEKVK